MRRCAKWPKIVVEVCSSFATLDTIMRTTSQKVTKSKKLALAQAAFAQLVAEASRQGFHGTAGLILSVQDGHIQHVKVKVERLMRE